MEAPRLGIEESRVRMGAIITTPGSVVILENDLPFAEPLSPILQHLRSKLKNKNLKFIDQFLLKTKTYSLQRQVFRDYYTGGRVARQEDLIPEELGYEKGHLWRALWNQWIEVEGLGPGIIYFPRAAQLPQETLSFLGSLLQEGAGQWSCCLEYDPVDLDAMDQEKKYAWDLLVQKIENLGSVICQSEDRKIERIVEPFLDVVPSLENLQELYHFFCFRDLIPLLEARLESPDRYTLEEEITFRILLGSAWMLLGEYEKASLNFYNLFGVSSKSLDSRELMVAHRLTGFTQYKKDNSEGSYKSAYSCFSLAEQMGDDKEIFLALFLILLNDARENRLDQEAWEQAFRRYRSLGESLGWINHLAYWLCRPDRLNPVSQAHEVDECQDRAIHYAKKLGNEFRMAAAFHTKGYMLLLRGEYSLVPSYYKKSEKLKLKQGNALETAYVQNGLGYFYHQVGKHHEAETYFFRSMDSALQAQDFHEVGMVLCNLAILYLYTGNPQWGLKYLEELIPLMQSLKITGLSYHSRFEIDGLCALAYLQVGRELKFRELLRRMDQNIGKVQEGRLGGQVEELLLYHILHGEAAALERNSEKLDQSLSLAEAYLKKHENQLQHRKQFFLMEKNYLTTTMKGFEPKRETILLKVRKTPDFKRLRETSQLTSTHQYMQKKLEEVHLLTLLRGLLGVESDPESMIQDSLELLRRSVVADVAIYFEFRHGEVRILKAQDTPPLSPACWSALESLSATWRDRGKILHLTRTKNWNPGLEGLSWVVLPIKEDSNFTSRLVLGILSEGRDFDQEDLSILSLAAAQISHRLVLLEQEQQIMEKNFLLENSNTELQASLSALKVAQTQLISTEKMAVLGTLVAGIAHEINTPLGIGVTAASYIKGQAEELVEQSRTGLLKKSRFEGFLADLQTSSELLSQNLQRASELIKSFKQVSVDQTSDQERLFPLHAYIQDIIKSLHPQLKRKDLNIHISCPQDLSVKSFPGAFSQILTNFCMNSLIHGFEGRLEGTIEIRVFTESQRLILEYRDNGRGMNQEAKDHHFEPFYTTLRNEGGTGLGSYIVYNLVTQRLKGEISLETEPEKGVKYRITIPL